MRIFILAIVAAGLILGLVHGKCLKLQNQTSVLCIYYIRFYSYTMVAILCADIIGQKLVAINFDQLQSIKCYNVIDGLRFSHPSHQDRWRL